MKLLLSSLLVSVSLWGADPPKDGPPDGKDGPPPRQREDRPRGRERGPRGGFDVDVDFRGGPPAPPRGPIKEGENWVIFGVIKTAASGETAPFDPSKGPVELELKDGRKITIDVLPPPPHPPGPPRGPRGPEGRRGPDGPDGPPGPPRGPHGPDVPPHHGDDHDRHGDHGPPHGEHGPRSPFGPDGPHPPFGPGGPGGAIESVIRDEIRPLPPDPEVFKLNSEEREIQHKLDRIKRDSSKAGGEISEATKKEVTDLVTKQFDLRQQIRRKLLERIQKDSKKIEESLQKREGQKQQLINERVSEILDPGAVDF